MPILTECPHCRKKFRAPDKVAGKTVKCPGCQGVVRVPEAVGSAGTSNQATPSQGSAASWYILTENREQMGPVSKEQLDNLATKGRLSFCQIRRGDWRAWKWADDIYPDLPASERKGKSTDAASTTDEQEAARLVICPDCGNTVSRRATRCPHCGCPASVLLQQTDRPMDGPIAARPPAPPTATIVAGEPPREDASTAVEPKMRGSRRIYAIVGGVVLLLMIAGAGWWAVRMASQQAVDEVVEQSGIQPPPPPEPEQPSEELLSADGKSKCIDDAARKMAEHIDELQRQFSSIDQVAAIADLWKTLASPNPDAIPESTDAIPGGQAFEPYKSQAKELFTECRDWVRENVKRGPCTASDVWETARQWAQQKQEAVLKPLGGLSVEGLAPQPPPAGP